jgi:hypothetical protein
MLLLLRQISVPLPFESKPMRGSLMDVVLDSRRPAVFQPAGDGVSEPLTIG